MEYITCVGKQPFKNFLPKTLALTFKPKPNNNFKNSFHKEKIKRF